jgi:hypothetical protein
MKVSLVAAEPLPPPPNEVLIVLSQEEASELKKILFHNASHAHYPKMCTLHTKLYDAGVR